MSSGKLMTTQELAEVLNVSKSTICRWRLRGDGPGEIGDALVWLAPGIPRYRSELIYAFVKGDAA